MGTSTELVEDDAARTDDSVKDTAAFGRAPLATADSADQTVQAFVCMRERLSFREVANRESEVIATSSTSSAARSSTQRSPDRSRPEAQFGTSAGRYRMRRSKNALSLGESLGKSLPSTLVIASPESRSDPRSIYAAAMASGV